MCPSLNQTLPPVEFETPALYNLVRLKKVVTLLSSSQAAKVTPKTTRVIASDVTKKPLLSSLRLMLMFMNPGEQP